MKKIVFILTMLSMVSTALGRVEISCTNDVNVVSVYYDMSGGDANLPRAFGLDVRLSNDANIVSTSDFNPDFWVHPGSIDVNTDVSPAVVDSNGTAILSDVNYPQAGGLVGPPDINAMSIEMGSLYYMADGNLAPDTNGLLFKFVVDKDCNVAISGNTALGKVVLENTTEDNTDYGSGCSVTGLGGCNCYGEVDGDGKLKFQDLGTIAGWINNYATTFNRETYIPPSDTEHWDACVDADGDGKIKFQDLGTMAGWINNYATTFNRETYLPCPHPYPL